MKKHNYNNKVVINNIKTVILMIGLCLILLGATLFHNNNGIAIFFIAIGILFVAASAKSIKSKK